MVDPRPFYHRFAWAYDQLIPRAAGPSPDAVVRLFRERGVGAGSLVVDAGCGTGSYAIAMASVGLVVVGLDRSPELLDVARGKTRPVQAPVTFVEADLLEWNPAHSVDGILCRGVLNDMISDDERSQAFVAFAGWLRPGGVLIADVRDWGASRQRYLNRPMAEMHLELDRGSLLFRSVTTLDDPAQILRFEERFSGTIDGQAIDERSQFLMRCWSSEELRERLAFAGFEDVTLLADEPDGRRVDRLVVAAIR